MTQAWLWNAAFEQHMAAHSRQVFTLHLLQLCPTSSDFSPRDWPWHLHPSYLLTLEIAVYNTSTSLRLVEWCSPT